ncbi:MAG TPA: hypothetical protein VM261_03545 [Kofleriaceae bacterium]|nr:hypothetical protein [Kofleriaceae bacterium]
MRAAALVALLASLAGYAAYQLPMPWRFGMAWFGAACAAVAIAYLANWPQVFGKRKDGRLFVPSQLLLLPYLLYARSLWHLLRLLSREAPVNELAENIRIGRRLLRRETPADVDLIVDLAAELPRTHVALGYLSLPILDAGVPDYSSLRLAIAAISDSKRAYIHCAQGHGRTATVAACVLISRGMSISAAIDRIQAARPKAHLSRVQHAFVQWFATEQVREIPVKPPASPAQL